MKKKLAFTALAATLLVATSVYASGTSTAYIASTSTGVDGNVVGMGGSVSVHGSNYSSSTNSLWHELYQDVTGPDTRIDGQLLDPGVQGAFFPFVSTGNYYVHLDPDGPFYSGCNGTSSAVN